MLTESSKHGQELVSRLKRATRKMHPAKRESIKACFWHVRGRQRHLEREKAQ